MDNMSNWLGFSLSPHLRIDEGFGRETQDHGIFPAHLTSVMPLRSDGSLCAADPFRRSNGADGIVACCELSNLPRSLISKHTTAFFDLCDLCMFRRNFFFSSHFYSTCDNISNPKSRQIYF